MARLHSCLFFSLVVACEARDSASASPKHESLAIASGEVSTKERATLSAAGSANSASTSDCPQCPLCPATGSNFLDCQGQTGVAFDADAGPDVLSGFTWHQTQCRKSAIYHAQARLLMCTIPKVASSMWRHFQVDVAYASNEPQFESSHAADSPSTLRANPLGVVANHPIHDQCRPDTVNAADMDFSQMSSIYRDDGILKVATIRNPLLRLVSAYYSKKGLVLMSQSGENFTLYLEPDFRSFVLKLQQHHGAQGLIDCDDQHIDEHVLPQSCFCDIGNGGHYNFFARYEQLHIWGAHLAEYAGISTYANGTYTSPITGNLVGPLTGSTTTNPSTGVSETDAEVARKSAQSFEEYDHETYAAALLMYAKDVSLLGYASDIEQLRQNSQAMSAAHPSLADTHRLIRTGKGQSERLSALALQPNNVDFMD